LADVNEQLTFRIITGWGGHLDILLCPQLLQFAHLSLLYKMSFESRSIVSNSMPW